MKDKWLTSKIGIFVSAVLTAILWGSAFPGIKMAYALLEIGSRDIWSQILFAGFRFTLAGVMTLGLIFFTRKKVLLPTRQEAKDFALLGFVLTYLCYFFFHVGLANTTGVKGAILGGLSTFATILCSHFLTLDDKLNFRKCIGCVTGFLGIVIMNLGGDLSGFSFLGEGCMLANALCFGLGSVLSKKIANSRDSSYISGYQLLFGGIGLLLTGALGGGHFRNFGPMAMALILYMAFVSAGGFALWTGLLKRNPSSRVAIYHFLTPVFGAVFSAVLLGEDLFHFSSLGALILVCLGIAVVNCDGIGRKKFF